MISITFPDSIKSIAEAKQYLKLLYDNGYCYHPDDSAESIIWDCKNKPNKAECKWMNKLMDQVSDFVDPSAEFLFMMNKIKEQKIEIGSFVEFKRELIAHGYKLKDAIRNYTVKLIDASTIRVSFNAGSCEVVELFTKHQMK